MYKMYFNTGVTPYGHNPPIPLMEYQEWRGGTKQIVFYLEHKPPENWKLKYLCDHIKKDDLYIPIIGGGTLSKYAIFTKRTVSNEG